MRKLSLQLVILAVLVAPLWAQAPSREYPKGEVFIGFTYLSVDGRETLKRQHAYGWGISAAYNLTSWGAIVVDGAGEYGNVNIPVAVGPTGAFTAFRKVGFSHYQVMMGPEFSKRVEEGRGFFHALFGLDFAQTPGINDRPLPVVPLPFSFNRSNTHFAVALGLGADRNIHKDLAIRVFQFDYLMIRSKPVTHDYRVQGGLVWKLGM